MKKEEHEVPLSKFNLEAAFTLRKKCSVVTDDYLLEADDFEQETWENTDDTDWSAAYTADHFTIPELLSELYNLAKAEMEREEKYSRKWCRLNQICNEAEGWQVVDSDYTRV